MSAYYQQAAKYWESAGQAGYDAAMFSCREVERHVNGRIWSLACDVAQQLNVKPTARVLDIGCGDGMFASAVLSKQFAHVLGIDLSQAAIERARGNAPANVEFMLGDLATMQPGSLPKVDAVFMMGILHHIKPFAADLLRKLRSVTDTLIVMEPNGSNLARKALEQLPSYKSAGEESFRDRELKLLFSQSGFEVAEWKRFNFVPNLAPKPLFHVLHALEPAVEALMPQLCTAHMIGLRGVN